MKIRPEELTEHLEPLAGALPAESLDIREPDLEPLEAIRANLTVQLDQKGKILVLGKISTQVKMRCGRCLDWIAWPIEVRDFCAEYEPPHPAVIDLAPRIREDILLQIPLNGACRLDKEARCPYNGMFYPADTTPPASLAGSEVWQALDQFKTKE